MAGKGRDEVMVSRSDESECSEATVEIKIKTLDSQTYTLRVDKCVSVPALKEQIATLTGVLSEQQRLICRGKVLKDDQLLSAYHVEDGHTLHLVVRQPMQSPLDSSVDHSENDPASNPGTRDNQMGGSSVVMGTFNVTEPGDGLLPDLSRIVSTVLGSFGVSDIGSGSEGADTRDATPFGLSRTPLVGLRFPGEQQAAQTATSVQPNTGTGVGASFSASVPLDPMQLPVIPDSLTTLSQYLTRMRHGFTMMNEEAINSSQAGTGGQDSESGARAASGGLPTPASLAEVILSTRQLLTEQAAESLSQLVRQLEDQVNVADPLVRMTTQSNAMRAGVLLQHLGALLLELGRTTMTLRMGQTPAESVVNAGPAVFISMSGPNPIMVQPLHFQPGMSFGAISTGSGQQHGSGLSGGSIGSSFLPRNIDIRIRTGPVVPSSAPTARQRESTGAQQSPRQDNQSNTDIGSSINESTPAASGSPSATREPEVRVIPIRSVVAALPASVRRSASDSSHGSTGLFFPILARVQRVSSRGPQSSESVHSGGLGSMQQPNQNSTELQEGNGLPGGDADVTAGDGAQNGQVLPVEITSGIDQLLRSTFPGENVCATDVHLQGLGTSSVGDPATNNGVAAGAAAAETASNQEAVPLVPSDGVFLSNLLHQIMPLISENTANGSLVSDEYDTGNRTAAQVSLPQGEENSERIVGRRRGNSAPSSSSKRLRRQ